MAALLSSDLLGRYVELGVSSNRPACARSLHALVRLYLGRKTLQAPSVFVFESGSMVDSALA